MIRDGDAVGLAGNLTSEIEERKAVLGLPGDLQQVRTMMVRLKLTVNESKTRVGRLPADSLDFLGYTIVLGAGPLQANDVCRLALEVWTGSEAR
jgi:hypothetical protein